MHGYLSLQVAIYVFVSWSGVSEVSASQKSQRLIVTLDVASDQAPEYLCIVSESRSCPDGSEDSNGNLIREAGCATRELSDLQEIGSLPADLSGGDVSISAPEKQTITRHYNNRPELIHFDADLIGALQTVSHRRGTMCDDTHEGCAAKVQLSAFEKFGRIICGRDGSAAVSGHNGRVAIVALSYHEGESRSGVQKVELHGTSATLSLQREIAASNFAFTQVIGGDYAFSATTSIGTNERIVVALHPRCTLFGVEFPRRSLAISLAQANIHLDGWGTNPASMKLTTCRPNVQRTTLPINIPYIESPGTKRLIVNAGSDRDSVVLEATWNGPLPPTPLVLAHRSFEFMWRRDCLVGEWPSAEENFRDASWNAMCPRATIEGSLRCAMIDQLDKSMCKYRCEIADSIPALPLPANVQFDRIRAQGEQGQVLYSWRDTISFSGQELQSFVAPSDRALTLEFADRLSWQDRAGDKLDEVRVIAPGGSFSSIDLTSQGDRELLPPWILVSTPNITCSSRLRVAILGASTYGEQTFAVDSGRVVLDRLDSYKVYWHPWFMFGAGTLGIPPESTLGLYIPRRSTPYLTIGESVERYIDRWPAAIEFRGLLDLAKTTYGVVISGADRDEGKITLGRVWYVRVNFGVNLLWWLSRRLHVGGGIGVGIGFPTSETDDGKVGTARWSFITELVDVQARLRRSIWLDVAVGIRWGEERNYFKTRLFDDPVPNAVRLNNPFITIRVKL